VLAKGKEMRFDGRGLRAAAAEFAAGRAPWLERDR
jgi:hypothetical protein